jgi:hypothetical protein
MFLKWGDLPPGCHLPQASRSIETPGRDLVIPPAHGRIERARQLTYCGELAGLSSDRWAFRRYLLAGQTGTDFVARHSDRGRNTVFRLTLWLTTFAARDAARE